jgi:single-strand DNA-binding protein
MSDEELRVSQSQVAVTGRMGTRVMERDLPSGDVVTTFTVVVDRPASGRREGSPAVDSIPCQVFKASIAKRLTAIPAGEWVTVSGTLRRRFWRGAAGLGSALEVEVSSLTRVRT